MTKIATDALFRQQLSDPLFHRRADFRTRREILRPAGCGTAGDQPVDRDGIPYAIAIKIRTNQIPASLHGSILDRFNQARAETFRIYSPAAPNFDTAASLLRDWKIGLRSGDALHLAIAGNRKATLVTLDRALLKTSRALGIAFRTL